MEWLQGNLAVLSGLLLPLVLVVVKPLVEREAGGAELRRIRRHAQLRALLRDDGDAAQELDKLLSLEVKQFAQRGMKRFQRKIDIVNLVMMVLISGVGGFVSFWLVTWAQSVTGFWAAFAWVLAGLWTLTVLLFVLVGGLQQLFKTEEAESSE